MKISSTFDYNRDVSDKVKSIGQQLNRGAPTLLQQGATLPNVESVNLSETANMNVWSSSGPLTLVASLITVHKAIERQYKHITHFQNGPL